MRLVVKYPWPDYRLSRNGRGNRALIARLIKETRETAAHITHDLGLNPMRPATLEVVRFIPPSARWDEDNLRAMGKETLDGIADAMGVNDKTFKPEIEIGKPEKGGRIEVEFELPPE